MTLPEAMRERCWDCGAADSNICAMCDAWYCDAHKKPHEHPEPQSGPARDAWLATGLPYDAWVRDTEAGRVWAVAANAEDGVPLRELERSLFSPEFIAEVDRDYAALKAALCSQCGGPFVPQADDADDACPFTVGRRFFSEGLQAPCRVLRASNEGVDFVSEGTADTRGADVRTEVPLELAHRHLTAGRWRLLPDALDTVRATTEFVAKALEPTVWDRIGALLQKLASMQGGPKQLTGKHVVKISYYDHDGSATVEVEDRGRQVAHSDEHFRRETPDALLAALEVVCKEVGVCT